MRAQQPPGTDPTVTIHGVVARLEWAARALETRASEWSSDHVLDPGDAHEKGERSLCVGEAA